jgi:hypothetical protein
MPRNNTRRGCTAAAAAAAAASCCYQTYTPRAPGQLTFVSQLTAIQFFTASGPIAGFPTTPLVPGDRIIGQDRILQHGRAAGHDNEACTVSFGRDVLCQDIIILTGQGDLQASWTLQWPAAGTRGPASFDGVIDGGTAHFAAAHGTFHAATLPDGDTQLTAVINTGQQ